MIMGSVIVSLLCSFLFSSVVIEKKNIVKVTTFALILWYVEYLIVSSVLLYMDIFHVKWSVYGVCGVSLISLLSVCNRLKESVFSIQINWKELALIFIMTAVILFSCGEGTQRIATDADEGMYYEKAITLLQDNPSYIEYVDEYGISNTINQGLIDLQSSQIGLYVTQQTDDVLAYEYHGLPLWPAVIALFMELFGVFNGSQALNLVFVISILAGYCCIETITGKKRNGFLIYPLFAFMPLSIYLAKVTLSEMAYVALLFSAFFILLQPKIRVLASVPLGLLGFLHISAFLYVPIFVIILFFICLFTRERDYGITNIIMSIIYLLSLESAYKLSKFYSSLNMEYTVLGVDILYAIQICFIIAIIMQVVVLITFNKQYVFVSTIQNFYKNHIRTVLKISIIFLGLYTIYQGYLLGFTDTYTTGVGNWVYRSTYANQGFSSLIQLNIVSIMMATGYLSLPYIVYCLFSKNKLLEQIDVIFFVLILEALTIYTVIRCDTSSNYYASRYFVTMLVPAIVCLTARLIKTTKVYILFIIVPIVTALPYVVALHQMVCYGGTVKLYEDVSNAVGKKSIVFLDKGVKDRAINSSLVTNLRTLNQNKVFEIDSLNEVMNYYPGERFYFVKVLGDRNENQKDSFDYSIVMKNSYNIKGDIVKIGGLYPLSQWQRTVNLCVYEIQPEQLTYLFGDQENFSLSGFHDNEHTFRWTTDLSTLDVVVDGSFDYTMKMTLADIPPLEKLGKKSLSFTILINGTEVQTCTITKNSAKQIVLSVPSKYWNKGVSKNTVTIKSEVWQPSEYGSTDTRYLGIAMEKIEFERID